MKRKMKLVLPLMKVRTARGLVKFIQDGLEHNGGDYQMIADRMYNIAEFVNASKSCGIKADFSHLVVAFDDFFVGNKKVRNVEYAPDNAYKAIYEKPSDENNRIWCKRGVAVVRDNTTQRPMLYFGRRKRWAEMQRNDTGLLFDVNQIKFHDEYLANYAEIPLWGSGTQAEFDFDHLNRLTAVRYREMKQPRLGLWGPTQEINFDCGYFLSKENDTGNHMEPTNEYLSGR